MASLLRVMRGAYMPGLSHMRGHSTYPLTYSDEVREAKTIGKPIVALESTIITHGMPYPRNLETALEVEDIIRQQGATPATIAILKGQLTVGLTKEQILYLAKAQGVVKASRRDLAPIMAGQLDGATTVAGTIIAAHLADIPIFVTGGIGGVHREGEDTMDVSADLTELGRSKTLVVCSGVKSILDIGRTLEYLDFPAFYTTRSGHKAPHNVVDATHAALILHAARRLQLSSGIVIGVPVPQEQAMDDIALIKNNAKVGANIAVQFQKLRNVDNLENAFNIGVSKSSGKCTTNSSRRLHTMCATHAKESATDTNTMSVHQSGDVLVIGGANVDRTYRVTEQHIQVR